MLFHQLLQFRLLYTTHTNSLDSGTLTELDRLKGPSVTSIAAYSTSEPSPETGTLTELDWLNREVA